MPVQSPGVFLAIGFSVIGAVLLLYVLVRLAEQCHRLSLKLCRPQYEQAHRAAQRFCCCKAAPPKEYGARDFEHDDGTLVDLSSGSSDGEADANGEDQQEQEADEDREARRYQEARSART